MLDDEQKHHLRRLRFPPALESEFQQDYYHRFLPALRVVLLVLAVIIVLVAGRALIATAVSSPELLGKWEVIKGFPAILGASVLLILLRHLVAKPGVWRFWQPVSVVFFLAFFGYLAQTYAVSMADRGQDLVAGLQTAAENSTPSRAFGQARLSLEEVRFNIFVRFAPMMMILLATMRLQLRWALLAMVGMVGIELWAVLTLLRLEHLPDVLGATLQVCLIALTCLCLVAFVQERLAREAFLASYLLAIEKAKSETLLVNILPDSIAARLKESPAVIADTFSDTTVLFADIADFTPLAARLSSTELIALLNAVFSAFDALAQKHGLEKIKTIGDAYMAVAGVPESNPRHAQAAAHMALDMAEAIAQFHREPGAPLRLRIGLHSGAVVAGVIGTRKFSYDLWGDTVNTASRMESHGVSGQIQVSETTYDLLAGEFTFGVARDVAIKGKGTMRLYPLESAKSV
jgi:class 3 adenylate cyclase